MLSPQYLAGVIDSDGSISINGRSRKSGYKCYRVVIQITWIDIEPTHKIFDELVKIYGGSKYSTKGSKLSPKSIYYKYVAESQIAENILSDIFPYLIVKKKQAELCLSLRKLQHKREFRGRGNQHTDKEWESYNNIQIELMSLNKKGKKNENTSSNGH